MKRLGVNEPVQNKIKALVFIKVLKNQPFPKKWEAPNNKSNKDI